MQEDEKQARLDADFARGAGYRHGPRPRKHKKHGGRKAGTPNKRTLAKLDEARRLAAGGRAILAVDQMDDMITMLRGLVDRMMPFDDAGTPIKGKPQGPWFRAVDALARYLGMRAPYQSPTLAAVALVPHQNKAQHTTVNVTILNERGEKVYSDDDRLDDAKLIEHEPAHGQE